MFGLFIGTGCLGFFLEEIFGWFSWIVGTKRVLVFLWISGSVTPATGSPLSGSFGFLQDFSIVNKDGHYLSRGQFYSTNKRKPSMVGVKTGGKVKWFL